MVDLGASPLTRVVLGGRSLRGKICPFSAFDRQLRVSKISAVATRGDSLQGRERILYRVESIRRQLKGKKEDGRGLWSHRLFSLRF